MGIYSGRVSFDIFVQPFDRGDAGSGGGAAMREMLAPYVVREEPDHHFLLLSCDGGEADVYLSEDSMM